MKFDSTLVESDLTLVSLEEAIEKHLWLAKCPIQQLHVHPQDFFLAKALTRGGGIGVIQHPFGVRVWWVSSEKHAVCNGPAVLAALKVLLLPLGDLG